MLWAIIISGLPHQCEPVIEPLLETLNPRTVIITDATIPASAHANRKLRDRLEHHNFAVWFTSDSGALTLGLKDARWNIDSAIPRQNSPVTAAAEPDSTVPTDNEPAD